MKPKPKVLSIEDKAMLFDKMVSLAEPRYIRKERRITKPEPLSLEYLGNTRELKLTYTEYNVWEVSFRWWQPSDRDPDFKSAIVALNKKD